MRRGEMLNETSERKMTKTKRKSNSICYSNYYSTILITIASVLCPLLTAAHKQTYEGYSLYRCQPQTTYQVERLQLLKDDKMSKADEGVQFWSEPSSVDRSVDIMVSPEEHDYVLDEFRNFRIPCKMIMYDVGEVIRRTSTPPLLTFRSGLGDISNQSGHHLRFLLEPSNLREFHSQFHSYSVIEAKLEELAKSPLVTRKIVGHSTENRPLYLVQVSSNHAAQKPVIFIDAGHHAREWISHSTLLYLIDSLIYPDHMSRLKSNLQTDATAADSNDKADFSIRSRALNCTGNSSHSLNRLLLNQRSGSNNLNSLLDQYDFWFLPVVNPDGYEFTRGRNRLWRKTRSASGYCSGVDPNRNYAFHWRESGADKYSCSDIYAGSGPLSEPETKIVANILDSENKRIVMYITLHAYSQMMLIPYGYASVYPDNYDQLKRIGLVGMEAIQSVRGTRYTFGLSSVILYPAAGGSDDYAHGHSNIKLVYTMELPDVGHYGFLMPPSEIIPVGEETTEGIAAMVRAI